MQFYIMTLFPEMVMNGLNTSITGRAIQKGLLSVEAVNIRDYAFNKHNSVDDYPYGGGAGMLMQAEPVYQCYHALEERIGKRPRVVYLSPQGDVFDQKIAESIAAEALSLYWERRSAGEEIQMVLPFLFSVIRNKALRHLRHESLKSKVHDDMSRDIRDELKFRIEALESCDPHTLFAGDVQKILHDTLDSLGGKTGRVFSLSRFNGMTNKEIAEKMGITEKTVEYHISKALKALRISLKDYLPLIAVFLGL